MGIAETTVRQSGHADLDVSIVIVRHIIITVNNPEEKLTGWKEQMHV